MTARAWPRVWCGGPAEPTAPPKLVVVFEAPTKNETNSREHFRAKAQRVIRVREATIEALATAGTLLDVGLDGPWCVRITRLSPSRLDEDATGPALKAIQDTIAAALGVDDKSPRVAFTRAQGPAKRLGVKVEIWDETGCPC